MHAIAYYYPIEPESDLYFQEESSERWAKLNKVITRKSLGCEEEVKNAFASTKTNVVLGQAVTAIVNDVKLRKSSIMGGGFQLLKTMLCG